MTNFDDLVKSNHWMWKLQRPFGVNFPQAGVFSFQDKIAGNLSAISMVAGIAKSMQQPKWLTNPSSSVFDTMNKTWNFQSKLVIPQTTFEAISSINRKHEQLFGGLKTITDSLRIQSPAATQINNLHFALSGISGKIAAIAAQQRNWTIIDEFEQVTEQALDFSESLTDEITEENQRQFQILVTLVVSFLNKHKTLGISALLVIDIILRFAGIHQYYDFLQDKPELATKTEINQISITQDSVLHFIHLINDQLKQANEYRITNRICAVKLKPKSKTLTILKLPKGFQVTVIQIHHKWIYVSYFDPKDNSPQTGWILKKYLDQPK